MTMLQIEMVEEDGVRVTRVTAERRPTNCPSCMVLVDNGTHACRMTDSEIARLQKVGCA